MVLLSFFTTLLSWQNKYLATLGWSLQFKMKSVWGPGWSFSEGPVAGEASGMRWVAWREPGESFVPTAPGWACTHRGTLLAEPCCELSDLYLHLCDSGDFLAGRGSEAGSLG